MTSVSEILNKHMENAKWIVSHYEELKSEYNEQWVAVHEGKVLDSDSRRIRLWNRLRKAHELQLGEIAIEYVTDKPMEMIL
jgi:phage FluMu gp28-like protein